MLIDSNDDIQKAEFKVLKTLQDMEVIWTLDWKQQNSTG